MDITEEHPSLFSMGSGLDFEIDPSSTSQNYPYDPDFEIFSNSVLSEVEPSEKLDPIFLKSEEVFSNFDDDSVDEFVEGFGEAPECLAPSSFNVPPSDFKTQTQQLTHYSDKYPLPNYFTALPAKGSSVKTSSVNNAEITHNKENQENFANPTIPFDTNDASQTYYYSDTNSQDGSIPSPSLEQKKSRYGGSRTPYRCGKCGQPKKGHTCNNQDGEPKRKPSKKRSITTSNTSSPASSEPQTPITPNTQDMNIYGTDYRALIQERNSRTANNISTDNGGAMSPISSLPNSPAPAYLEISNTKLTPITKSFVITPKSKSLKSSINSTVHSNTSPEPFRTIVLARKSNK